MNALNSYTVARDLYSYTTDLIQTESSVRVLEDKGIFIIPYDTSRKVAFVTCQMDVISTVNESRTLWSNPELSFYGYCHIRSFKQSIGSPVQLNQRSQILFTWFPQDNIAIINSANFFLRLTTLLDVIGNGPEDIWLSSPLVTDFSFGLQRTGKIQVTVDIGYFNPAKTGEPLINYVQNIPDPQAVQNTDPSTFKDLGDPETIPSPPYRPEDNDFGESSDAPELPGEPPAAVPFRIRYSFQTPDGQTITELTIQYSGATPTSISVTPVKRDGIYVATVRYDGGTAYIPYRSSFATQAQEDAFVSTFEFVEYVYGS